MTSWDMGERVVEDAASGSICPMTGCARAYFTIVGRALLLVTLGVFGAGLATAQTSDDGPLHSSPDTPVKRGITNDSVVRMTRAGLDETIILQTIQAQPAHYDLAPDNLIALKEAGVSGAVIAAMQAKAAGLSVRIADGSQRGVVPGPLAPALDEVGVYYKDRQGDWVPLKTERVVFRSGGWLKSAATYNIIKEDMNGHMEGASSPLALHTGVELLVYTTPGTDAAEYAFLRFTEKKDSREFRIKTGGVFHSETGTAHNEVEFNPKRIAPQIYSFTVPVDIEKGQYGVLPPGASNQRGLADTGKIFTFSITE